MECGAPAAPVCRHPGACLAAATRERRPASATTPPSPPSPRGDATTPRAWFVSRGDKATQERVEAPLLLPPECPRLESPRLESPRLESPRIDGN